ncbi:tail protein X [Veillonella magna]|uniref:tail protein X n=1 Tax=Veillonella magna TaxID=464322 RepID=UPI0023F2E47D|nr:tail protein X [Veillonella magna]
MINRYYYTVQGDMWDGIAVKVYGDESYMSDLIKANKKYSNIYIFPANIKLLLPDVQKPVTKILPPWKRGKS